VQIKLLKPLATIALCAALAGIPAQAQESAAAVAERKKAQNPIANIIKLPFQNNTNFDYGPDKKAQNVLNVQPVYPMALGEDWNLINRLIVPIVSNPSLAADGSRETGLGDTTYSAFFSPSTGSTVTWGVGVAALLPTATDDALGAGEWGLGPSFIVVAMPGAWVTGFVVNNIWGINEDTGNDVNQFYLQYFLNYNFTNGYYLTTAPINTKNWEAPSGEQWTIPIGGGFGKVFKVGNQPMDFNAQVFYNVEKPSYVGDWSSRLQLQWLFGKK
jgi:hypothetical protein